MKTIKDIISRILFFWGAAWLVFLGIMGTWLHSAEYPIKGLVVSAHNHGMSFAFGALLAGLIIWKFNKLADFWKWIVAILVIVSFLLPLGLLIGGMTGNPGNWMTVTSAIGGWGFVVYWIIIGLVSLFWRGKKESKKI